MSIISARRLPCDEAGSSDSSVATIAGRQRLMMGVHGEKNSQQ